MRIACVAAIIAGCGAAGCDVAARGGQRASGGGVQLVAAVGQQRGARRCELRHRPAAARDAVGQGLRSIPGAGSGRRAQLQPVWRFQSTNIFSCTRQPDTTITCTGDHGGGFEWCINAVAVDRDGTVYADSEDGNVYAINADGTLRDWVFLDRAIGAAYTPIALDRRGHVFALNSGHLAVVGGR